MATLKFYDDFKSPLALWISPQTGGTWHAPDTWEESGNSPSGNTNDWWIDPLYPATSQADANPFSVSNSILNINVIQRPADVPAASVGNCPYISGKIVTNGRFQTTYGFFEARIKMPKGNGFGAAFWLNPHDGAGWPPEIDITEMVSVNPTITTFAVWSNDYGSPATNHGGYLDTRTIDLTADYHYYALNWQSDFMTWYLDGQQIFQQPTPSDCHQDFYIILDTTAGAPGGWGGAPDGTTPFPGQMQVDYVAVWDVSPYAGGAGGTGAGLNLWSGGGGLSSPDGTVLFKDDGTSITDANGHVWTINGSGQVTVDGTVDTAAPSGVAELAYVGGSVWRFIPQLPYITPGVGSFTDSSGNIYTITTPNDVATENGLGMNGGAGTGAMGYYLGTVYGQDEVTGNWFTWDGVQFNAAASTPPLPGSSWARKTLPTDAWVSGSNPLTAAAYTSANNDTVILGSASKLIDANGNAYGLVSTSGGEVVANGVADTSLTGVTETAYVGGNIWRFQSSTGLWWFETSPAGPWQPTGGTAVSPLPATASKRSPADQPFSSTSVWNIGIGSGATWGASTDADVQQLVGLTGNLLAATNGQPIFFGAPSDPLVQITCTDTTFPVPTQLVHIPLGSVPSAPTDRWMNFFDLSQPTKMWSYAGCRLNNNVDVTGGITATKGGVWDCSGDGVANAINPGSDYNFLVGTITDYDLQVGAIQHALRFSLGVDALKSPGATWTANIPWPGTHEDLNGPTTYKGNITYGCTIGIPSSTALPVLTRGGTWLANALQRYGAICRIGSAANGSINFYTTPGNDQNQNIVQMRGDLSKIIPLLKVMRNQAPASVNGGGSYPPQLPPVDTNPVYYQPQYRPTGTQTWINFGRPIKDTNVVITGLQAGTSYDFDVVAFNARGSLTSSVVGDRTTTGSTGGTGPGPSSTSSFINADFTSPTGQTIYPQLFGVATGGMANGLGGFTQSGGTAPWADVAAYAQLRTAVKNLNIPLIRVNSLWMGGANTFTGSMLDNLLNNITNLFPSSITIVFGIECSTKTFAAFQSFTQAFCQYWKNHAPAGYKIAYVECMNEQNSLDRTTYNSCFSGMVAGAQAVDATIKGAGCTDSFFGSGNLSSLISSQSASTLGLLDWHAYQYLQNVDATPSNFQVATSAAAPNDISTRFNSGNLGLVESGTYAAGLPGLMGEWNIEAGANNETRTQTNIGACFMVSSLLKGAAASASPAYGAVWDIYNDAASGYNLIAGNQSFTLGAQYYTLQNLISAMPGAMANTTTGNSNISAWASKPASGGLGVAIVNADTSAQAGQVALSHWPVNGSGTGSVSMWQLSASNYSSGGATSIINVSSGLTDSITLPPMSVTILSSGQSQTPEIVGITLSNNTIQANAPSGTVIGIVSVTMNFGSFSGSLAIGGADASKFSLSGNTLSDNTSLALGNYSITITATQSGIAPLTKSFTIVAQSALPGAPTNVTSPSQSSTQVVLSWSPPTIGARLDFGAYQVQYKTTSSGVWLNGPTIPYCTPGSGSFTDIFGNTWSLNTSNRPVVNGSIDTVSNAAMLLTVGGLVWQIDTIGDWYSLQPTGTITDATSLQWSAPTTTSPLTDVVVSGLSASTSYNFQVYVSNTAGNGPPASSSPSSISTVAVASIGPTASSAFLTADFTSAMQWPVSGGGQQNVVQQLWGISSSTLTNPTDFIHGTGTPFFNWLPAANTSALGAINPGLVYLKNGGQTYWDGSLNVIPSVMANLVDNFYKIDPLGITKVIFGVDFDLNVPGGGVVSTGTYATAMANLARYLSTYRMPNGRLFPLVGMMGNDEPDGKFSEATTASYYNAFGPAVKAVSSSLLICGPNLSFMNPWLDFGSLVPSLDIYSWDTFTGSNSFTDPFDPSCYSTDQPTRYTGDANTGSTSLTRKPLAMMVGGYGVSGDTSAACDNSYVGAVYVARSCLHSINNANVPMWMGLWGGFGNGTYGVVTDPSGAGQFYGVTNTVQVTPKGYMMAQAVRKIYGQRWNTPTNSTGLLTCAVTPSTGRFGLMIVNPGLGNKSGTVALSHVPVGGGGPLNSNGTGLANVWQMTSAQTAPGQDGAYSTVQVTNGVTSVMSFPDPSVTIISV